MTIAVIIAGSVSNDDAKEIFLALAVQDVQRACDLMRPVWERTGGVDGYVSLEVDPTLAYDTEPEDDTTGKGDINRTLDPHISKTFLVDINRYQEIGGLTSSLKSQNGMKLDRVKV